MKASFHSRSGLAGYGGGGLGECTCITSPCFCPSTMEYRMTPEEAAAHRAAMDAADPNRFGNAMSGMKWLAVGVAVVVLFFALESRR